MHFICQIPLGKFAMPAQTCIVNQIIDLNT